MIKVKATHGLHLTNTGAHLVIDIDDDGFPTSATFTSDYGLIDCFKQAILWIEKENAK